MNLELARKTIAETFRQKFDDVRFLYFVRNLVNHLDETKKQTWTLKKAAFEDYVNHFTRLGTYSDPDGEKVDVLVIYLRKNTTLSRGRVTLRNFVADYLATGHGQGKAAVMAAFVSPEEDDWRFSFVKLDFTFEKTDLGFVSERVQLTPARRYSYLVGKNENCHTAQKQFLALLTAEEINPNLAQLEAAFSVEKVTKEFFDHYRELFEKTRDSLAVVLDSTPGLKEHFDERGIACDDFAKKLLGQIVFLYFLQKKGWFGVARGQDWGKGRKDFIRHLFANRADYVSGLRKRPVNFFNDILEPLFYEAIAAPRTDDDHYYSRFDCRIPFLNGGLFEPLYGYNWVDTEILLPDTLFANAEPTGEEDEKGTGILDVFDRYNFTVNESEPLEKEVAVDPEMLGKVFENLLPENIRHSSGTYYTPRVIVHYMCQQALLHYLTARAPQIPPADLASFLRLAERYADFEAKETKAHADKLLPEAISQNAGQLDDLLATITVCDPAIGSGAFPVGMMLEIVRARMALTGAMEKQNDPRTKKPRTAYALKRDAIQHSLYGVDLDPGAVEIAKLRLWLSMVVDEDEIRDIQPLPNLDYKIMQGNSLLEEFNGVRLLDDKLLQPPAASTEIEIAELKARISKLQAEAIRLHGEGKKGAAQKLSAEQDIKRLKKQLNGLLHPETREQGDLAQQDSWKNLLRIQELHNQFFDENARAKKDKLRKDLDGLEWEFMEATLREQGRTEAITELKRASATHRKPFFLWRLHFGEVFRQRGGFDVVIANPPYVRMELFKSDKPELRARYSQVHNDRADLYCYFYARALQIMAKGGALSFITSNKFFRAEYGEGLRDLLATKTKMRELVDFGDLPVFDASAYPCIVITQNQSPDDGQLVRTLNVNSVEELTRFPNLPVQMTDQKSFGKNTWRIESTESQGFLAKVRQSGKPLREHVGAKVVRGITTGLNEAFVVDRTTHDRLIKEHKSSAKLLKSYVRGRDVKRWGIEDSDLYIIAFPCGFHNELESYPAILRHIQKFESQLKQRGQCTSSRNGKGQGQHHWLELDNNPKDSYLQSFDKPKIVSTKISIRPTFAFDSEGHYLANTTYFFPATAAPLFLLGLLNSNLFQAYAKQTFVEKQNGWYEVQPNGLESFPIPAAPPVQQKAVEVLVESILAAKSKDATADVSKLEEEIDKLVYALYRLTPEEIKIVEASK